MGVGLLEQARRLDLARARRAVTLPALPARPELRDLLLEEAFAAASALSAAWRSALAVASAWRALSSRFWSTPRRVGLPKRLWRPSAVSDAVSLAAAVVAAAWACAHCTGVGGKFVGSQALLRAATAACQAW